MIRLWNTRSFKNPYWKKSCTVRSGDRAVQAMSPKLRTQVTWCRTFRRSIVPDHMKWRPLFYRPPSGQPRQAITYAQYSNVKCVIRFGATLYKSLSTNSSLVLVTNTYSNTALSAGNWTIKPALEGLETSKHTLTYHSSRSCFSLFVSAVPRSQLGYCYATRKALETKQIVHLSPYTTTAVPTSDVEGAGNHEIKSIFVQRSEVQGQEYFEKYETYIHLSSFLPRPSLTHRILWGLCAHHVLVSKCK
jgi:hypothetical protein